MASRKWTFLLAIKGTNPDRMAMLDCADYIRAFARLLGHQREVHLAGVLKGSVALRAYVEPQVEIGARRRLLAARTEPQSDPGRIASELLARLSRDSMRAVVTDKSGSSLLELSPPPVASEHDEQSITIADEAVVDGEVVGIVGADDTAHLQLRDFDGSSYRILIRNLSDARALASRWRGEVIRCRVKGTWTRGQDGRWVPGDLSLLHFDDIDQSSPMAMMERLREIPGNGWAAMDDPRSLLEELRGS